MLGQQRIICSLQLVRSRGRRRAAVAATVLLLGGGGESATARTIRSSSRRRIHYMMASTAAGTRCPSPPLSPAAVVAAATTIHLNLMSTHTPPVTTRRMIDYDNHAQRQQQRRSFSIATTVRGGVGRNRENSIKSRVVGPTAGCDNDDTATHDPSSCIWQELAQEILVSESDDNNSEQQRQRRKRIAGIIQKYHAWLLSLSSRSLLSSSASSGFDIPTILSLLVGIRESLPALIRKEEGKENPVDGSYKQLDRHMQKLLSEVNIFDHVMVKRVTKDNATNDILQYMVTNERVHPVSSVDEFGKSRLAQNQRVFGLFWKRNHNNGSSHTSATTTTTSPMSMPLMVLHVSLQYDIPASMADVLEDSSTPTAANKKPPVQQDDHRQVATFYSISNFRPGLSGLSGLGMGMGEHLIHQAVEQLRKSPTEGGMNTFVTLSPVPGFQHWLDEYASGSHHHHHDDVRREDLPPLRALHQLARLWKCPKHDVLFRLVERFYDQEHASLGDDLDLPSSSSSLQDDDDETANIMRQALQQLAAWYIVHEKKPAVIRDDDSKVRRLPLNGVTRFHCGNGAQVYRINTGADAWHKNYGVMVNYKYNLDELAENQRKFQEDGKLSVHENVEQLLLLPEDGSLL